jgi:hypothetical protein
MHIGGYSFANQPSISQVFVAYKQQQGILEEQETYIHFGETRRWLTVTISSSMSLLLPLGQGFQ